MNVCEVYVREHWESLQRPNMIKARLEVDAQFAAHPDAARIVAREIMQQFFKSGSWPAYLYLEVPEKMTDDPYRYGFVALGHPDAAYNAMPENVEDIVRQMLKRMPVRGRIYSLAPSG